MCAGLVLPPDPAGEVRVRLATGGHPPPVVLRADGTAAPAALRGPLIGVLDEVTPGTCEVALRPGDRLVMFTDGLTEGPLPGGRTGEEGVVATVAELSGRATGRLAEALAESVRGTGGAMRDDVAVLALEATGHRRADGPATA